MEVLILVIFFVVSQKVLDRGDYEFALDRTCVQFDPDEPEYHDYPARVYDHIEDNEQYDKLISTRHYGPMAFYLAWNNRIDRLLFYYVDSQKWEDGALLVSLFYQLHPELPNIAEYDGDNEKIIDHYVKNHAVSKRKLEQIIKMSKEIEEARRKMEVGLENAVNDTSSDSTSDSTSDFTSESSSDSSSDSEPETKK